MSDPIPLFADRTPSGRNRAPKVTLEEFTDTFVDCFLETLAMSPEQLLDMASCREKPDDVRAIRVKTASKSIDVFGAHFVSEQVSGQSRHFKTDETLLSKNIPFLLSALNILVDEHIITRADHFTTEDIEPLLHTALRDASIETFKTNIFATPSLKR